MRSLDSFHDYNAPTEWKKYVGESTEIHDAASKDFWNTQAPKLLSNRLLGIHAQHLDGPNQQLLAIERCRHLLDLTPRNVLQTTQSPKFTVGSGDTLTGICKEIIKHLGGKRQAADALLMCSYLSRAGIKVDQLKKGDVIQLNPPGKSGGYLQIIDAQTQEDIGDYCVYGKASSSTKTTLTAKTQISKKPQTIAQKTKPVIKKPTSKPTIVAQKPKVQNHKPKKRVPIDVPPPPIDIPQQTTNKPQKQAHKKPQTIKQKPKPIEKKETLSPKERALKRAEKEANEAMKVLRGPKMQNIIDSLRNSEFHCDISFERQRGPNGFPIIEARMSMNYHVMLWKYIRFNNERAAIGRLSGNGKIAIEFWNPIKRVKKKIKVFELKKLLKHPEKILTENLKTMRKNYNGAFRGTVKEILTKLITLIDNA